MFIFVLIAHKIKIHVHAHGQRPIKKPFEMPFFDLFREFFGAKNTKKINKKFFRPSDDKYYNLPDIIKMLQKSEPIVNSRNAAYVPSTRQPMRHFPPPSSRQPMRHYKSFRCAEFWSYGHFSS